MAGNAFGPYGKIFLEGVEKERAAYAAERNAYTKKVKNSQNKARNSASTNRPNNTARLRSPLNRLSNASPYKMKKSWWRSRKTRLSKKNRSTRKRK